MPFSECGQRGPGGGPRIEHGALHPRARSAEGRAVHGPMPAHPIFLPSPRPRLIRVASVSPAAAAAAQPSSRGRGLSAGLDAATLVVLCAASALFIWPALLHGIDLWTTTDEFSYGLLVLPVA